MAILGRGNPAKAIIVTGQGVNVSGDTKVVVQTTPVDRRFKRVAPATVGFGPGVPVSGDPRVTVVSAPRNPRYSRVYPAIIGKGSAPAAPDVSPYTVLVNASPVPATWKRVNPPVVLQGSAEPVPGPIVVVAAPVPRAQLRITGPTISQGTAEPVPGPVLVVYPRNPKVLAARPIIVFPPAEAPFTPASPPLGPYVFPGPNPHRTTRPPTVFTQAEGIVPPIPPGPQPEFCALDPITGWYASSPVTDWYASSPITGWAALDPEEECC